MVLYFKQFFQYLKTHFFALILEIAQFQAGLATTLQEEEKPQSPTSRSTSMRPLILFSEAKIDVKMMQGVEIMIPRSETGDEALIMTLETASIDTYFSKG